MATAEKLTPAQEKFDLNPIFEDFAKRSGITLEEKEKAYLCFPRNLSFILGSDLNSVNLKKLSAILSNPSASVLKNLWFNNSVFHNKNLTDTDFRGSVFNNCHFEDCNFTGTNLRNCHLQTCTGLTQEQIEQAEGNEYTKLPKGLYRPEHWFEIVSLDRMIMENNAGFEFDINKNNKIYLKYL